MRSSWIGGSTLQSSLDDGLAIAVHRHEADAVERFVGRYERSLFNYARRLLDSAEDAQEVVQDTFLRAYRALTSRFDEARCRDLKTRAWLFRIARNLAFNKRRKKGPSLEDPLPNGLDARGPALEPLVEPVVVLCEIEKREELARLDRALMRIPVASRELIFLRFLEEMSYSEMVEALGAKSEATLRGRVFRALKHLRQALNEEEPSQ